MIKTEVLASRMQLELLPSTTLADTHVHPKAYALSDKHSQTWTH
jgi:hypothetical protein